MTNQNTAVIVVDTNRPSMVECEEILYLTKTIVVMDHHRQGAEQIENASLSYVEPSASSACEMISEILQYYDDNIKLKPTEADCIYAGIIVDTNNFVAKTGMRTFEAAAFLRRNGADMTRVRKTFRNDMETYKARAEAVRHAETFMDCYAISMCPSEGLESPTVVGAQAANELLNIVGVKASFVLTEFSGKIFISARSIDEVNVQLIMERLGGGGHINIAGAQLTDVDVEGAKIKLKEVLTQMTKEGAI
jgi:c-di-AMP phosphodiesterase-like protein